MLGQICGQAVTKMRKNFHNFPAKILPDDIHRANQFHAHPYHHLLACPNDDNQWFWGGHQAHVSHAGTDLWSGCDKNEERFNQLLSQNPT
jgi:hypothetical protein